ncbi:MAG: AAA family ATPase, partial [Actinobacteria bacterium]|nr:AAA family ATPase [Actinomycetota bacterium]
MPLPRLSPTLTQAAEAVQLDRAGAAAAFVADPDAALLGRAEPLLLDEWQAVPGVLGAVKRAIDVDPRPGRFILTGSVRADLRGESWSGTGRIVRLAMSVLTQREVNGGDLIRPGFLDRLATMDLASTHSTGQLTIIDYATLAMRGWFPEVVDAKSER